MHISDNGLNIIKEFEGYGRKLPNGDCTAYQDYLGNGKYDVPTIGWGCTHGVKMGDVWTVAQAEEALRNELSTTESAVTKLCKWEPTQNQFDALCSFTYNVGEGALERSSVLRLANAEDFAGAARAFNQWTRAQGNVLPGLVRRRHEEAALFLKEDQQQANLQPDEPKPEVEGSRKDTLNDIHIAAAGGTAIVGAASQVIPQLQTIVDFLSHNSPYIIIGLSVVALLSFLAMKFWMRQDKAEGRYIEHA